MYPLDQLVPYIQHFRVVQWDLVIQCLRLLRLLRSHLLCPLFRFCRLDPYFPWNLVDRFGPFDPLCLWDPLCLSDRFDLLCRFDPFDLYDRWCLWCLWCRLYPFVQFVRFDPFDLLCRFGLSDRLCP